MALDKNTKEAYQRAVAEKQMKVEAERKATDFIFKIAAFIITIVLVYVLFSNFFAFKVLANFGIAQYVKNIVHLHKDSYVKLERNFKLYEKRLNISDLENPANVKAELKKDQIVKVKGYSRTDNVSYIAVQFYNSEKVSGYIFYPKNIGYDLFSIENQAGYWKEDSFSEYEKKVRSKYLEKVNKSVKILKEKIPLNIEKFKQSNDFKAKNEILDDEDLYPIEKDVMIYVSKEDFAVLKKIHESFYDKDLEADYIQFIK